MAGAYKENDKFCSTLFKIVNCLDQRKNSFGFIYKK